MMQNEFCSTEYKDTHGENAHYYSICVAKVDFMRKIVYAVFIEVIGWKVMIANGGKNYEDNWK